MGISTKGLNLIKKYEGCKLTAYKDAVGVWTIGYGHTEGVTPGMTITQQQAECMLKSDANKFFAYVENSSYVPVTKKLNQNQKDALTSFAFNLGQSNLKTLCKGRDVKTIGEKMVLYNKAGGRVLQGLVERRNAEKDLYFAPVSKKTSYYKKYTGRSESLVDALNSMGINSTYANRKKIAAKNGIKNYSGTAEQNKTLLILFKQGKLKK